MSNVNEEWVEFIRKTLADTIEDIQKQVEQDPHDPELGTAWSVAQGFAEAFAIQLARTGMVTRETFLLSVGVEP